ncbi:unnamed protein product [Paramecium pentaurelia]|uniref:Uncharacterized protein n=1 Tax=Paramecium pentaurelia TaxID=43138 RepID=A0A8S1TWV4_9CILI|nr:unnamed protein product [Paramecium pentaurelia]
MQWFRAFLIFDFKMSKFYLEIRRDIEFDDEWKATLEEIKLQINIQNVFEEKVFQMRSNFGSIRGKFDIFTNRLLVLISSQKIKEIFQAELLLQIYSHLFEITYYQNINITELELYQKFEIQKIINIYEQKLIIMSSFTQYNINEEDNSNSKMYTCLTDENDEQQRLQPIDHYIQKPFKGFMMYDQKKRYFLMLIRKGFNNDQIWIEERVRIEKLIMNGFQQNTSIISITTQFASYLIEYDSQTKFFFILLSNYRIPDLPQFELLNILKVFITNQTDLQKQIKYEIENQCLCSVSDIIDAQERIYLKRYHPSFYKSIISNRNIYTMQTRNLQLMDNAKNQKKKYQSELSLES